MHKLMLALIALVIAPASITAEPQRLKDDPVEAPCDNLENTEKPPCDTDSESIETPPIMPTERDSIIVPPDIPAEGLPHQDGRPSSDDSRNKPSQ